MYEELIELFVQDPIAGILTYLILGLISAGGLFGTVMLLYWRMKRNESV
jgi:hypothetical protein